jgi:hypothetical protein
MMLYEPEMQRTAVIDLSGRYRYVLTREWGVRGVVTWIMLNPSTADADNDDPTIRRCIGFSKRWGFGGLRAVNLFAYRATNPSELRSVNDPVGPEHQRYFRQALDGAGRIVAAWGSHAVVRLTHIAELLQACPVMCLGTNADGQPKHPLYVRTDAKVQEWKMPR